MKFPGGERDCKQEQCGYSSFRRRRWRAIFGDCGTANITSGITVFGRFSLSCDFWFANKSCFRGFDFGEKAVPAPGDRFHEAGTLSGVTEGFTEFVDGFVEPVVEIHKSIGWPEFFLKFLARYDLTGALQQQRQDLEGLLLEANSQPVLPQFASAKIQLEHPKPEPPVCP